ncbi:MAG: hypothetical protein KatS3mg029_0773 [Saprospiraceae bacterium]|nr:MAG: hypothetical protein KatS3mg029_0773 [Saprospiraceae bacterium]
MIKFSKKSKGDRSTAETRSQQPYKTAPATASSHHKDDQQQKDDSTQQPRELFWDGYSDLGYC